MVRAGVLELRNHLSRYLKRVATGETVVVTSRARDIAVIRPLTSLSSAKTPPARKLGWMKGRGRIRGDLTAPVVTPDEWDANRS